MTGRFNRTKNALLGSAATLLLGGWCSSVLASNDVTAECEALPAVEIPAPSLTIRRTDHGLTESAADMKDAATEPSSEEVSSPALADAASTKSTDSTDTEAEADENAVPVSNPPETALRLPGVSEEDQPRFRRQMYRTDI